MLDVQRILESVIASGIGAAALWLFGSVFKLRRDLNAAWGKIRELQKNGPRST